MVKIAIKFVHKIENNMRDSEKLVGANVYLNLILRYGDLVVPVQHVCKIRNFVKIIVAAISI